MEKVYKIVIISVSIILISVFAFGTSALASTVNVALNKPATATMSRAGYNTPGMAVDGDTNTMWNSGDYSPASLTINLQSEYNASSYEIVCVNTTAGGNNGTIHFLNANGTEVATRSYSCPGSGIVSIPGNFSPSVMVESVRIDARSSGDWINVDEFQLYANTCTPNATKQCVGSAVYNYDSCGTQGTLYQQCQSNQTCNNGVCAGTGCPLICGSSTYVCGADGKNYCNSCLAMQAGTTVARRGRCPVSVITCSSNTDCGTNAYTGSPFCSNAGNVYQNYITYTCNNQGSATSFCSNNTVQQLKTTCSGNQTCSNGSCAGTTTNCTYHSYQQCVGNYLYWYDSCGTQQDSQYCPNGCSGNSCTNNSYNNNYNYSNCTQNSYQQCVGNYLYWYNSCGQQQSVSQYCQNGCSGNTCQSTAYNNIAVQTNAASNTNNNQATLNGYLSGNSNYTCNNYVWFQYGLTTAYGSETLHQSQTYSGSFSQAVSNLPFNGMYHFRAAAQDCSGTIVYGQDMSSSGNNVGGGILTVNKTVRNLSNSSGFASSTSAAPGDMVMFMITLQANGGQDVQNVVVRDYLPANLTYSNQLVVACTTNNTNYSNCNGNTYNYTGDITSGVNLNTIYAGQTVTITYQTQVGSAANFSYGSTTLTNNVSVTTSNGSNPTSNASVIVTRGAVLGASTISTGLTNNIWVDSFFLPLLITLFGIWMLKSGMFFGAEKWIDDRKKARRGHKAEKELNHRIAQIRETEGI
jgi:fimbrial isopeptide formation D2 family protein